jgi:hypothetical protein
MLELAAWLAPDITCKAAVNLTEAAHTGIIYNAFELIYKEQPEHRTPAMHHCMVQLRRVGPRSLAYLVIIWGPDLLASLMD